MLVDGPSARNAARLSGRSAGNHVVIFDGSPELSGQFVQVQIDRTTKATLYGALVADAEPVA